MARWHISGWHVLNLFTVICHTLHPSFFYHLSYLSTYLSDQTVSMSAIACLLCMHQEPLDQAAGGCRGLREKPPPSRLAGSCLATLQREFLAPPIPPHLSMPARSLWPHWCVIVTSEARPNWPPTQRISNIPFLGPNGSHYIWLNFLVLLSISHTWAQFFSVRTLTVAGTMRVPGRVNCHHWTQHDSTLCIKPSGWV